MAVSVVAVSVVAAVPLLSELPTGAVVSDFVDATAAEDAGAALAVPMVEMPMAPAASEPSAVRPMVIVRKRVTVFPLVVEPGSGSLEHTMRRRGKSLP